MATLKRTMFREYDIRGREAPDELNEESVFHIARGFAKLLTTRGISDVVAGHDARGTSDAFHRSALKALTQSGINVVDIGTVTTPMSYWAQYHLGIKGLCMITASHNPVGWNGLKLGTDLSDTLLPKDIQELYNIIENEDYVNGAGTIKKDDVRDPYMNDIVPRAKLQKPLKVLINTGNGTAGLFAPDLLRRFGCTVVEHFTNVDPTYPNYTANPDGHEMMEDTGRQTTVNRCDIGFAIDGDGDRLGVTDEKGNTIWPDRYLILLSRLVLEKSPGAKIVFDVKVSEALPEDIKAHGGIPIMWKTGHSYIKSKLSEEKAALAGEMSGHVFFSQDYYGYDDALFTALKLLEYLSEQSEPLSQLISETPYYVSTPTIQVKTTDEDKYRIVEALTKGFQDEGFEVFAINGARVYVEGGWGLVRASSNTPTLVLRFEAKTQEKLDAIMDIFKKKLEKFPEVDSHWDTSGH